jgi:hypothetical protein
LASGISFGGISTDGTDIFVADFLGKSVTQFAVIDKHKLQKVAEIPTKRPVDGLTYNAEKNRF